MPKKLMGVKIGEKGREGERGCPLAEVVSD
jgi:hypothetical protein